MSERTERIQVVDFVLRNNMKIMGQIATGKRPHAASEFSLEFLNVNMDITALTQGVMRKPSCRICLYGPSGTGKTSYGVYLAKQLDKPLMIKRASDLLGSYVGETERNIAKIFHTASVEGAVLMIDEADSFLQERKEAHRSWEITQVNELLTQMESFEGVFICSTNLMRHMDHASLRRFDFKIHFDYLNTSQRWRLFIKNMQCFGADLSVIAGEKAAVDQLDALTPGDFSVACRQFAVLDTRPMPKDFLRVLAEECESKPGVTKSIGFI